MATIRNSNYTLRLTIRYGTIGYVTIGYDTIGYVTIGCDGVPKMNQKFF